MATSWKITNKRLDSGPDWESWDSASETWENLTTVYFTWNEWTFSAKANATDNWTVITNTKGKLGTET